MTKKSLKKEVYKVVKDTLCLDENSTITDDSNLVEDLNADPLDSAELAIELSSQFGIEIPDEDWGSIETVGEIVEYLAKQLC